MVDLTRVGTARSSWTSEGSSVLGPDEDLFTLAATAAELAMAGMASPLRSVSIEVVEPLPPVADWALPALLGLPGSTTRATSLGEAIQRHPSIRPGDGVLIVHATSGHESDPLGQPVGLAMLLESSGGWDVAPSSRSSAQLLPPPVVELEALRDAANGTHRDLGGGSYPRFTVTRTREIPFASTPTRPSSSAALRVDRTLLERVHDGALVRRVSQGAYIPRARYAETLPSRWRFIAEKCPSCGALTFPARGRCRGCGHASELSSVPLPLEGGRVLALTTIGPGGQPTEFDPIVETVGGYQVAIVELAPGCRATLQVTDSRDEELAIGDPVSTRLRRLYPMEGEWRYGRKVVPRPRPTRARSTGA